MNGVKSTDIPTILVESEEKETHEYSIEYHNELTAFSINFLNKSGKDTIVKDGKIVGDVNIIIKKVTINDIDFTNNINTAFNYTDTNGNLHKTSGFMHASGSMSMNIQKNILFTEWISSFE